MEIRVGMRISTSSDTYEIVSVEKDYVRVNSREKINSNGINYSINFAVAFSEIRIIPPIWRS